MPRRTWELLFRHLGPLVLLLALPAVVGLAVAYTLPRAYQCTAGLKALERYTVINTSGVSEANLQETPAQTQTDALNDDLTSPGFDWSAAQGTGLPEQVQAAVGDNTPAIRDAIFQDLSSHVLVVTTGVNHYTITYTNQNQQVAYNVVGSIIAQWTAQGPAFAVAAGQKLLGDEQAQLVLYQRTLDAAVSAQKAYAAAHPGSTAINDPNYAVLVNTTTQEQNAVANEQAAINNVQAAIDQLNTSATLFQVSDPPQVPYRPVSRTKTLAIGGGGGLAMGLLMAMLALALIYRRDRAVYGPDDLVAAGVSPMVIAQIPRVAHSAVDNSLRLLQAGAPAGSTARAKRKGTARR
jgi:hypothetical protein